MHCPIRDAVTEWFKHTWMRHYEPEMVSENDEQRSGSKCGLSSPVKTKTKTVGTRTNSGSSSSLRVTKQNSIGGRETERKPALSGSSVDKDGKAGRRSTQVKQHSSQTQSAGTLRLAKPVLR